MSECTCRGGNPDCCFCGGSGFSQGVTPKQRRKKKRAPKKKCPYCDAEVRGLRHHISLAHYEKWESYCKDNPLPINKETGEPYERCSICKNVVSDLNRHIKKCHPDHLAEGQGKIAQDNEQKSNPD